MTQIFLEGESPNLNKFKSSEKLGEYKLICFNLLNVRTEFH